MDFCVEAMPFFPPDRPARCRFCLQPEGSTRLKPRDLRSFYTTLWPCGLGQQAQFTQCEQDILVCAYCWTRARQCVQFVQCARTAERFLSSADVQPSVQTCKFYNLSITVLEPTEYSFRNYTQEVNQIKFNSSHTSCENPSDAVSFPPFQCELPKSIESHSDNGHNVKIEKNKGKLSINMQIEESGLASENKDVNREPSVSDDESTGSSRSKGEEGDTHITLCQTTRKEIRETEVEKLKNLHMEPLRYTFAEQLEEIALKKKSESYLSKKFKCERCGFGYNDEEAYDNHIMRFHDQSAGEVECAVCGYRLAAAALRSHRARHERRWRCADCGRVLAKRGQCAPHRARCGAAPQAHACHLCGNTFPSEIRMKIHVRKSHTRRKEKTFSCDICGRSFIYKYQIKDHIRSHLNIKPFQCDLCGKKFTNQSLCNSHQKAHGPPAAPEERYCVECDRHFTSPRLLESHLTSSLRHVTKDSFRHACSSCPERFKVASHLRLHVTTVHLDERAHACQLCDKAYYTKAALKIHVRNKHTQRERRRDHACPVCGKSFMASTTLKDHMVGVHSNERPYACDICGATFGFKAALYTHNKLKHKAAGAAPPRRLRAR